MVWGIWVWILAPTSETLESFKQHLQIIGRFETARFETASDSRFELLVSETRRGRSKKSDGAPTSLGGGSTGRRTSRLRRASVASPASLSTCCTWRQRASPGVFASRRQRNTSSTASTAADIISPREVILPLLRRGEVDLLGVIAEFFVFLCVCEIWGLNLLRGDEI